MVVWGNEGGEEGQVYGEGRGGHGTTFADLFTKVFGARLGERGEL